MILLKLLMKPFFFLNGGPRVLVRSSSSPSCSASSARMSIMDMVLLLRRKAGVASNFMLDEEVPWVSSSSRFLFRGVANESSMNRFPLEAGVRLPRTLSIAGDSAMVVPARFDVLGVAAMLGSMVFNAGRGLDGVPADRQSNKLRIWPSLRGVGPRCIRKAAGVGSISSSSSSSRTSSLSVAGFVASGKGRTAARDLFLLGVAATGCNRLSLVSLSNCTDADGFVDRDSGLVIWGRRSLSYSLYFAAEPF